jgi:hypothetical protein
VIFSLSICSANSFVEERHGAELIVEKRDGQVVRGELITTKQDSLLLVDAQSGADMSVYINDIYVIKVIKKSKTLSGLGLGFLAGVSLGALGGLLGWEIFNWAPQDTKTQYRIVAAGGAVGGLAGALIGGTIGTKSSRPETFQIAGEPQERIDVVLEKLRSKSRVPNYQ